MLESLPADRSLQVAALMTALPDEVGALLTRDWCPEQLQGLSLALLDSRCRDRGEIRRAVHSFALEMQAATGVRLPALNRRNLARLCRLNPAPAAALLSMWLLPTPAQPLSDSGSLACLAWTALDLTPLEVACILILSCHPVISAPVFEALGQETLYTLTLAISEMSEEARRLQPELLEQHARHFEPFADLARRSPQVAAACVKRLLGATPIWDRPLPEAWTACRLGTASLIAVLLEDLEVDLVEQFFQRVSSQLAHDIKLARSFLCPAQASVKRQLLADFFSYFGPYEELAQDHPSMLKCLIRISRGRRTPSPEVARLERDWAGLRIYYGDLLSPFFTDPAVRAALTAQIGQLQSAWQRTPLEYLLCMSHQLSGFQVRIHFHTTLLEEFELPPGAGQLSLFLRHALAAQAQNAAHLSLRNVEGPTLAQPGLAALAVIRSVPADLLALELSGLEQPQLGKVAESLAELLSLPSEKINECIRNSCLVSPSELMRRAGLKREENCGSGARTLQVAMLVTLSSAGARISRALLPRLAHRQAVELTENMIRLFYRWEERPLTLAEAIPAGFSFLQWRDRHLGVCSRQAGCEKLADSIARLWPPLTEADLQQVLHEEFPADPERTAALLEQYLETGPPVPNWVPGPLLAAQFVHGLQAAGKVRQELWSRCYPIPCLPVDLVLLERAQLEWSRAAGFGG
ncbi:MAG: hypothetical protein U0931_24655 [Vulcanimicrobiota bacterium]